MSYGPVKQLESVPEEPEVEVGEGSETDVELGKVDSCSSPADETLSFLGGKLRGEPQNSNPARVLSRRGAGYCLNVMCGAMPWIISMILAILVVVLALKLDSKTSVAHLKLAPTDMMYTLAEDAVEYRIETTYASEDYPDSEYQGWPTTDKDKLWNKYEDGNYLWVDPSTAAKLPFETEHAPSTQHMDDYVVGLSVFHVLHCLSVLRRHIYPRRYNASLVNADGTVDYHKWHHVDHCLETVRRDILCHADTAATTWQWIEASQMTIRPETKHVCRNFDKISAWAYERHVVGNQRTHVEEGQIVDYTGKPPSEAWNKIQVQPPADWAYRVEDL